MPGHARAAELKWGGSGVDRMTMGQVLRVPMIPVSIEPERYRMKRLTEWLNLVAALIRLGDVISRTGWF